jgi:predicted dehydrogenase
VTDIASSAWIAGPSTPRVAIVGCGAIAELFHLPALARHPAVCRALVLVDPNRPRAEALAQRFGAGRVATDLRTVLDDVGGVIVTVPAQLHHSIALECLQNGKHVLCEKPLASTRAEVNSLLAAARLSRVTLSVNNTRRLYPSSRRIKELIGQGALGRLRRIELAWGEKFDWPAASAGYFGPLAQGKGVLLDKGSHALDLVCWWLGARPRLVACHDDSFGGTEATVSVTLEHDGCEAQIELSWLSPYANAVIVEGHLARVENHMYDWKTVQFIPKGGRARTLREHTRARVLPELGYELIDNWLQVIRGGAAPLIPGEAVADSIALIEECYAGRQRYAMPWHDAYRRIVHA